MTARPWAAAVLLLLVACAHNADDRNDPLARAAGWLQGRFDNAAQVRADPRFLAVTVRWTPIWPGRDDGRWFLVEQALAGSADAPYRRRVHRLQAEAGGGVVSEVFLLPAGTPEAPVAAFTPDALSPQPGCAVHLRPYSGGLRGATRGHDCLSHFRGAKWTTAEVVLTANGFASWDRGFAADGTQVWGALTGPYDFRRSTSR